MAPKKIHRRRDADPGKGLEKYGRAEFADPVNNKYPIDTPVRIKAAWTYIHQSRNAQKYTAGEVRTIKARVRAAAKARKVALPDPDEFVALLDRVRKEALGARATSRLGLSSGQHSGESSGHVIPSIGSPLQSSEDGVDVRGIRIRAGQFLT
jgi:hypothetical protein